MVGNRRGDDAEDDRDRPAIARRQHQCEQLRLVAELADRDRDGRDKECIHDAPWKRGGGARRRRLERSDVGEGGGEERRFCTMYCGCSRAIPAAAMRFAPGMRCVLRWYCYTHPNREGALP